MDKHRKRLSWLLRVDTLLLLVALIAGVAGAVLSARYLGQSAAATEASLRNRYQARAVVVAAADLSAGESLDATRLAIRRIPKEFLPDDAVPSERAAELIGGRTSISIRRGTPVVAAALMEATRTQRLSSVLSGERRALTIAVDQVNSQAGNLVPGDWVDLLYSHNSNGDSVLVPLLQHVEVLAAGNSLLGDNTGGLPDPGGGFSTITLGLSADDAARIVLAQQSGDLSVVLRAPLDTSHVSADPRSSRELLRRPSTGRPAPAEPRVEVLVGGSGALIPERSWLTVGQGRSATAGDAS
ncbi:MAG: Flp pilus assembly protein CpaB [Pseudomonadota bacterium]